jgi:hypothetical protein
MFKATLGTVIIATAILLAASFANVSAEPKAPKAPSCSSLKDEFACRGRDDCQWVAATINTKTGKEKRKAYCGRKPAPKKK